MATSRSYRSGSVGSYSPETTIGDSDDPPPGGYPVSSGVCLKNPRWGDVASWDHAERLQTDWTWNHSSAKVFEPHQPDLIPPWYSDGEEED